jgi:RHS repeat-associated protein
MEALVIAAKHFDPVVGIDIHIVQPPGSVPPVPTPHLFIGFVIDPLDYAPWIGATVFVNGVPRGQAGTFGYGIPGHSPIGGVFVKPPANECEIFMGSATVLADGEPLSSLGMPVLSCSDIGEPPPSRADGDTPKSMMLPTSVVLSIPMGAPVLVGGPPTISMTAMAARGVMAGLGAGIKKLRRLRESNEHWKAASAAIHKRAKRAMDKLGVPPHAQKQVHKRICTVTGHPVDVATGKLFTDFVDFVLPGPLPLEFERDWYSCDDYCGPLGRGWHHCLDLALAVVAGGVAVRSTDGRPLAFPVLQAGERHFDRRERMTLERDARGYALYDHDADLIYRFTALHGDELQPLTSIETRVGHTIALRYDHRGRLQHVIDSCGRRIELVNDDAGRIVEIRAPHPSGEARQLTLMRFAYDEHGRLGAATDAEGHQTRYAYQGPLLVRETDANGLSFYFEYDGDQTGARCVRTWGDGGLFDHALSFDDLAQTTDVRNSLGDVTTYHWNQRGLVVAEVDPLGHQHATQYDEHDQIVSLTDPLGGRTLYAYDARGNLTRAVLADQATLEQAHDERDQLVRAIDYDGTWWQWRYDEWGRVTLRLGGDGSHVRYGYEGPRLVALRDAAGLIELGYDAQGCVDALRRADGVETRWWHDALGSVVRLQDELGLVELRWLDALGRPTRIHTSDGNEYELEYDGTGNVLRVREPDRERSFGYFGLGKLSMRREAGTTLRLEYDTEARLVAVVDEAGQRYAFEADAAGNVTATIEFDGSRTRYERDALGRTVTLVRPSGATSRYRHDPLGRVIAASHDDGGFERFVYAPGGRLLEATNELSKVRYQRDVVARVSREWQDEAWIESSYDRAGRRTALLSSIGARHGFEFDAAGFVSGLRMGTASGLVWAAALERDGGGNEIERRLPGGVRSRWRRDLSGHPVEHQIEGGHERQRHLQIAWGSGDRIASSFDVIRSIATEFDHDARGHLTRARRSDGTGVIRSADVVGNLFRRDDHADRQYGPGGQLLAASSEAGSWQFAYDLDGRMISRVDSEGRQWQLEWDVVGNLRRVRRPDGLELSYGYDALGRRITRDAGDGVTRFIWDGDVPLHEQRGDAVTTWLFEPGAFSPAARLQDGRSCSVVCDERWAPVALFDGRGQRVWSAGYSIYGELELPEGSRGACPFRLPGQAEDEDTGLYYNRFRWYDPALGLYLSKDPIGLLGGERLYAYVPDLFAWYDPFGLIKAPASLLDKPGVYILTNGNEGYVGSSGIGKQGMYTRVSTPSHEKVQKLLKKPGTVVQFVEVVFPDELQDHPKIRNTILRNFEQRELDALTQTEGMRLGNSVRAQAKAKQPAALKMISAYDVTARAKTTCA